MFVVKPCRGSGCQDAHLSDLGHLHLLCDLCSGPLDGNDASLLVRLLPTAGEGSPQEMRCALLLPDGKALYGATFALFSRCAEYVHAKTGCSSCLPSSSSSSWAYLPLVEATVGIALQVAGAGYSPSSAARR